jgi:hypothetical protein
MKRGSGTRTERLPALRRIDSVDSHFEDPAALGAHSETVAIGDPFDAGSKSESRSCLRREKDRNREDQGTRHGPF